MIWAIASILKHVLLPPLCLGWLVLIAMLTFRKRPRLARWLLGSTLVLGYLCAIPLTSDWLMSNYVFDKRPAPADVPQAIVILGGGQGVSFDPHGKVIETFVRADSLERITTGAQLHRLTKLPVLVTGGLADGPIPPEAESMRAALERNFNVPVRWAEGESRNTVENAKFSAPLLRAANVKTIFLVTSDYHMRRARELFEAQGLVVVPVAALYPLGADGRMLPTARDGPLTWRDFAPGATWMTRTFFAANESIGMLYARINMR